MDYIIGYHSKNEKEKREIAVRAALEIIKSGVGASKFEDNIGNACGEKSFNNNVKKIAGKIQEALE